MGDAILLRSPMHDVENDRNPFERKMAFVQTCLEFAAVEMQSLDRRILTRAHEIELHGVKLFDSLHLSCAEAMESDSFLTCDDRIIKRYSGQLKVEDPVSFLQRLSQ